MAVRANTVETYGQANIIKEDLQETYDLLSPEETPFQAIAKQGSQTAPFQEWPVVELAAPVNNNRVAEGESDVANDAPNTAKRLGNYSQISDKVAEVSHTAEATDAIANNLQRMAQQVLLKMKELKRDTEVMLLSNVPALPGSSGTARQTAGLPAFLRTNVFSVAGGANPTLSGTTEGYPNAGATGGTTPVVFAEAALNSVIEKCWNEGANPSIIMVNGGNKRRLSQSFTGNATRYKDTVDKTVVNAIDIYDSDFGTLTVMPNRFQPTIAANNYAVYVLDPDYVEIDYLESVRQKDLAETGHAKRKLVWAEYSLKVENEKAHGIIRDTTNALT